MNNAQITKATSVSSRGLRMWGPFQPSQKQGIVHYRSTTLKHATTGMKFLRGPQTSLACHRDWENSSWQPLWLGQVRKDFSEIAGCASGNAEECGAVEVVVASDVHRGGVGSESGSSGCRVTGQRSHLDAKEARNDHNHSDTVLSTASGSEGAPGVVAQRRAVLLLTLGAAVAGNGIAPVAQAASVTGQTGSNNSSSGGGTGSGSGMQVAPLNTSQASEPRQLLTMEEETWQTAAGKWSDLSTPDVYYPSEFEGLWLCSSRLVAIDTPLGESLADMSAVRRAQKELGISVAYSTRFFPFHSHIVVDRALTTRSLVAALMGADTVTAVQWSPQRPNVLRMTLRGDYNVENRVTRRAFSQPDAHSFNVLEYSLQVFDNPRIMDGPPTIKASQNVTKYRWVTAAGEQPSVIQAEQRVEMFAVAGTAPGDERRQLSATELFNLGSKPVTVYRYELELRKDG